MHHPRPFPQKHAVQLFLTPQEREQLNEDYNVELYFRKKKISKYLGTF